MFFKRQLRAQNQQQKHYTLYTLELNTHECQINNKQVFYSIFLDVFSRELTFMFYHIVEIISCLNEL